MLEDGWLLLPRQPPFRALVLLVRVCLCSLHFIFLNILIGGFNIFEKRSEEDEIDDFERIEISLPESPRNANVNEELFSQDDDNAL